MDRKTERGAHASGSNSPDRWEVTWSEKANLTTMLRFAACIGVCAWALIACIPIFLAADAIVWLKTAHASNRVQAKER